MVSDADKRARGRNPFVVTRFRTDTMPGLTKFPSFPANVPTHSLVVVDYQLLKAGHKDEIAKLWHAATHLGFW